MKVREVETPEPRRGVRKPPKCPTVAEEVVETDALCSEHAVIQAPGGLLRFTASTVKPGADTAQIKADWGAARARTAVLAERYRRSLSVRDTPKIAAPRSRAPRPAAPHRRGSRRSADKGDDPDDGDHEGRVCLGCSEPLIGYRRQAKFHGEGCRSQYRRDVARAEAVTPMTLRSRPPKVCLCRADIVLLVDDLGTRCATCAKPRQLPVASVDQPSTSSEREMAVAA